MGWQITAVNRRKDRELEASFPDVEFLHFDVRDYKAVENYFEEANRIKQLPSVYFLSAGINKVDNLGDFSTETFREVLDVNLLGVLNFVGAALPYLKGQKAIFVAASSTTNIFPNPNCLGYYVSKLGVYEMFRMMDRRYRVSGIRFKALILGPVATNIFASGKLASKIQAAVRDMITVSVDDLVGPAIRFIHSSKQAWFFPKSSCALFFALKVINTIVPFYRGSAPAKAAGPPNPT
jgi:NAD(P)-dependent dehydrogenase (short-subunit alcohol dehydrogenase family)